MQVLNEWVQDRGLDLLELRLQAVVTYLTWMLETGLRSSRRAARALSHWAVSPGSQLQPRLALNSLSSLCCSQAPTCDPPSPVSGMLGLQICAAMPEGQVKIQSLGELRLKTQCIFPASVNKFTVWTLQCKWRMLLPTVQACRWPGTMFVLWYFMNCDKKRIQKSHLHQMIVVTEEDCWVFQSSSIPHNFSLWSPGHFFISS